MIDAIAAIGNAASIDCWSGIPYHWLHAARRRGWPVRAWELDLRDFHWSRRRWNLQRLFSMRGTGGYQYSREFLAMAERRVFDELDGRVVLSFHHHFPRATSVQRAGGRIIYYLDATLGAQLDGYALDVTLPSTIAHEALLIEAENLAYANQIVTMSRWLRDYLVERKQVDAAKIAVIMPGANLNVTTDWSPPVSDAGDTNRPFTLGLIGNDWQRKGLPFLIQVVRTLKTRGVSAQIRVIGRCPPGIDPETTSVVGPISKAHRFGDFVAAVAGCDLGCLFSSKEAFGISLLEFLRVGVPVAGFAHEGPADSLPPDAGFRFPPESTPLAVADALAEHWNDPASRHRMRRAAREWAPLVSWDRCIGEFDSLLTAGRIASPVQPWLGHPSPGLLRIT